MESRFAAVKALEVQRLRDDNEWATTLLQEIDIELSASREAG